MGATFDTATFDSKPTQRDYDRLCEDRAHEHGHSGYSGTFAENRGALTWHAAHVWKDVQEAVKYLDGDADANGNYVPGQCVKWQPGIAVPFKSKTGKRRWLIGAICSE